MPSGAAVPPCCLDTTLCPVPSQPHQRRPGTGPRRGPGPSSSLPPLLRPAQAASLTQIIPEEQGLLPSAPDCALTSSSLVPPPA